MASIAIIGGGIVGSTAAFYLAKSHHDVTVFDDGIGQATKAAAGIISPWLSQRRNKKWYELVSKGAAFYNVLLKDLQTLNCDTSFYRQNGTVVFKKNETLLQKLEQIALERQKNAVEIGEISRISQKDLQQQMNELTPLSDGLFVSGGALIDGALYVQTLLHAACQFSCTIQQKQVTLQDVQAYDIILLASGARLPELLTPLHFSVDVYAQKGQLFEVQLNHKNTEQYPVLMPQSEIDLLPFSNGKWVIGATHENDKNYDLTVDMSLIEHMKHEASLWLPELKTATITQTRVGTRAYTSDFTPFFGKIEALQNVYVASGLGSSGLTSGPFIAYLLTQMINAETIDFPVSHYSPNNYIQKLH